MIFEFGVDLSPEFKSDKWHIAGRCYTDIYTKSVFTLIVQKEYKKTNADHFVKSIEKGRFHTHLLIEEIYAYRKRFNWISKGMTALLVVSGDGSALTGCCTLRGEGEPSGNLGEILYSPPMPTV
jgi:hypothetical protein